jgi:hypothetical protein
MHLVPHFTQKVDLLEVVIHNRPTATTANQVRSFLGFVGLYPHLVKDFNTIDCLLNALTK